MTSEERDLITGLFTRLRSAETGPRDPEADKLIADAVGQQPGAPYRLAQTVLVQEHALANAQARIKELERQVAAAAQARPAVASGGGGFLAGLFGGGAASSPASGNIPPQSLPAAASAPYPSTVNLPASAGGGFLRSALSTAAGVAGGAMLFQGIENLLGHRSGAFGSALGGGGGFMDTGFGGRPEEITEINNYYGSPGGQDPAQNAGLPDAADYQDPGAGFGGGADPYANDNPPDDLPVNDLPTDGGDSFNDDLVDSSSGDFATGDDSSLV